MALGAIQMDGKRLSEAEQTYKVLASSPQKSYKTIHVIFLYRTGKTGAAMAELEKLVREDLDDQAIRAKLLFIYSQLKRTRDEQDLLAAVLKRNPRDADALLRRGQLYTKIGRVAEADQDLKQVLQLDPGSAEAH